MNRRQILKSIFVAPIAALLGTKIVGKAEQNAARFVMDEARKQTSKTACAPYLWSAIFRFSVDFDCAVPTEYREFN